MRAVMLACVLFGALGCGGKKGGARISTAAVIVDQGTPLLVVGVDLRKRPPGDATRFAVAFGSIALAGRTSMELGWDKLAAFADPSTPMPATPSQGTSVRFKIPLALNPSFETKVGRDLDLNLSVMWGTDKNGDSIEQARKTLSLDELYRRDLGLKPVVIDKEKAARAEHEQPGLPP